MKQDKCGAKSKLAGSDILLLSTSDWDNPFWTNKQHVALALATRGHRVLYVESLGLRRPTVTGRDLSRIWRRLKRGLLPPRKINENLWIWSPIVVPLHGAKIGKVLNRSVLSMGLHFWLAILGLRPRLLWTYSPITTDLFNMDGYDAVIYHAVDDIKEQPRMPRKAIAAAEFALVKKADFIFVTSDNLYNLHKPINPNTWYFPNAADYDHFQKALAEETDIPEDMLVIPAPRLGLVGAISGYKIDLELLCDVARSRPNWSIVLIGEVGEGDPQTDTRLFRDYPNIYLIGPRPYKSLPAYLKGIDVAIMANRRNEYTKSMFPMKFFEYLAAGRSVVSCPLEALKDYGDVALFCEGTDAFIKGVETILSGQGPSFKLRLERAKANTYKTRTEKMLKVIESE
jgi:glycosyltransferase involved in cell wall biosynthesis